MTELTAEDRRIRAQQALDAINNAGWVFDEWARDHFDQWLNTGAEQTDTRERLWRAAHMAMRIKAELVRTINEYEDAKVLNERRERVYGDAD